MCLLHAVRGFKQSGLEVDACLRVTKQNMQKLKRGTDEMQSQTPGFKATARRKPMQLLALLSDLVADEKTLHPNVSLMSYHHPDTRCCSQLDRKQTTICNREGTRIAAEERKHSTEGCQARLDAVFTPAPLSAAPSTKTARHGGHSDSDEQERGPLQKRSAQ